MWESTISGNGVMAGGVVYRSWCEDGLLQYMPANRTYWLPYEDPVQFFIDYGDWNPAPRGSSYQAGPFKVRVKLELFIVA
jgi:hypothetical protein